jgi:hypothetical protein
MFALTGLTGDFLKLKETRALFRQEQHFPSAIVDRGLAAMDETALGVVGRARQRVEELVASYQRRPLAADREQEMIAFALREGRKAGLDGLPEILRPEYAPEPGTSVMSGK